MTSFVVAKFGGTSVADYDAMNRSADVVLADPNTRLVVLSASAGVTNLLVSLSEGLEATERFVKLDALRKIQFDILERLQTRTSFVRKWNACWKISPPWQKPRRWPPPAH